MAPTHGPRWHPEDYRSYLLAAFPTELNHLLRTCRNHTIAWALEQLPLIGAPIWGHGVPDDADLVELAWYLGQLAHIHGDANHHGENGNVLWTPEEQRFIREGIRAATNWYEYAGTYRPPLETWEQLARSWLD